MDDALGRRIALAAVALILLSLLVPVLFGGAKHELRIIVPAGSQDEYVFCDEEISSGKGIVTVSSGKGLGDTAVILERIDKYAYAATYLTPGMPVDLEVEPSAWYRVGIAQQNPTDEDQEAFVVVKGDIELRIE